MANLVGISLGSKYISPLEVYRLREKMRSNISNDPRRRRSFLAHSGRAVYLFCSKCEEVSQSEGLACREIDCVSNPNEMVVRRVHHPTGQTISTTSEEGDIHDVINLHGTSHENNMAPWRNTHSMRPHILAAMANGRVSGRISNTNLQKMRLRLFTNASKSLDLVRQNLQTAINEEIDAVVRKYLERFFQPAVKNIRDNLGPNSVTEDAVREVCRNMLEDAKQMYAPTSSSVTQKATSTSQLEKGDECLESIPGYTPLLKWDPSRVKNDTQFILSSSASKALGVGSARSKQCLKHPDLVRYVVDQDDREWLGTARVPGLVPGTPNISLLFLEDILHIINLEDYNNPNLLIGELRGFVVPDFIQRKIRAYMTLMRTKYLPTSTTGPEANCGGVECVSSSGSGSLDQGSTV